MFVVLLFCLLTVLTQVGGLAYLLSRLTYKWIDTPARSKLAKGLYKVGSFLLLYSLTSFVMVPLIARPLGRVPLPFTRKNHLQPLNIATCFLNRNYVRPQMKAVAFAVSNEMNDRFPGTTLNYLDASFPFFDKFPLFPHLSHNVGKKLDFSFCYRAAKTGEPTNGCPSFIGYGICEGPRPGETNTTQLCSQEGYWQYGLLAKVMPQRSKKNFSFDSVKTAILVNLFADQPQIGKIFIEPHLKTRLHLTSTKIRFQGCQAVRHDDHIHIQLR